MPFWKCEKCGYIHEDQLPPSEGICPSCKDTCTFKNVTCYLPECGHEAGSKEHIDPRL